MDTHLLRSAAVAGAAALALTTLAGTTAARAAPGDGGTLVVSIVDQDGIPTPGILVLHDADTGSQVDSTDGDPHDSGLATSPVTRTLVPAGSYSMQTVTTWSGVTCVGATPCRYLPEPGTTAYTSAMTMSDDTTTSPTMTVTVPSISGAGAIGSTLTATLPAGLHDLQATFDEASPGQGLSFLPTVQWLRAGVDVPGATGLTYLTTVADGGRDLTARFSMGLGMAFVATQIGASVAPMLSNAISVAAPDPVAPVPPVTAPPATTPPPSAPVVPRVRALTVTAAVLAGRARVGRRAHVRVTVVAGASVPTGVVTLALGRRVRTAELRDGTMSFSLPRLRARTYRLRATFLGSDGFAASASPVVRFRVRPAAD